MDKEITEMRSTDNRTYRPTVQAMEDILFQPINVLDHGFVRVVDYMGSDASIVQAARVSYGKGTKKVNEDQGLINYLLRHRHSTPFEMCEIKFHIKLPIFIARQWIRHRTANVNEYSARYSVLDKEFYIPDLGNVAAQSTINNQGRGETLSTDKAQQVLDILREDALRAYDHYQDLLNLEGPEGLGVARELARMNLPVNFYTQWYWKIDLHNLMHFLQLRADPHAQYEIRVYAEAMLDILKRWVPMTYRAFQDYRQGAAALSSKQLEVVKHLVKGQELDRQASGLTVREWKELMEMLDISGEEISYG